MAEIRDTLRLEVDQALAAIDQVERRLDNAVEARIDIDTRSASVLASALETAERAASTLRSETDATATAADRAERSYSDLADSLGVSETRAAQLADEAKEAALSASQIERQARDIAQAMGLSESETRQFVQSLRAADRAADDIDRSTNNIGQSLRRVGGFAVAAFAGFGAFQAIQGLARGAGFAIDAYADSVEEASKAQTVFGQSFSLVEQFVADSANTLRASRTEAIQATAAFGAFFTGIGFGADQAARLSTETVQLAADIGSFNNLDFGEALEKLRSGLAGETEPLRQLGAGFNEAELQAKALELGLGGATGALTEQEKVTARLAIITERTSTAQGDAARTADQLAGRIRRARAEAEDLAPAFGEALLPAFEALLDVAPQLIQNLGELAPVVAEIATQFAEAAPDLVDFVAEIPNLIRQSEAVGRAVRDGFSAVGDAADVVASATNPFRLFAETSVAVGDGVSLSFEGIATAAGNLRAELDDFEVDRALRAVATLRQAGEESGLDAGVASAAAFGAAIDSLGDDIELTADRLADFSRFAGLDNLSIGELDTLADVIRDLELPPGQADATIAEITRIRNAILSAQFSDRTAENLIGASIASALADVVVEAERARPTLENLFITAEEGGQSFLELAESLATTNTSILDGLSGVDQIEGALQIIAESAEGAAERYRESFDVILTETNKAGDEVPRTIEQLVTDFETQAQRLADFQATIATLALSGFDDLAATLAAEGPAALDQALAFVDDTDLATRAENALQGQGVEITDSIESELQRAIEGADFSTLGTEVGLGLAEGLTSPAVIAALRAASQNVANELVGTVKGTLEVRSPSRVFMRIGEQVGEGLIIGFSSAANRRVPALTGVTFPTLGTGVNGAGGGGTVINNTVTNTVTLAGRDEGFGAAVAAQLAGTVGGALRGFSGAAVRV